MGPMKPTRIFLDSGDPQETRQIIEMLGFLDGQTTNPSLVSKNPEAKDIDDPLVFYKKIIQELSSIISKGSISVEVYSDKDTKAEEMLKQAKEMFSWIPNAHVKFPITAEGLKAVSIFSKNGGRLNMTLCFTQDQAAAVHAATVGAKKGDVFVSPFVGRLDDKGENGMSLIENILKMYADNDSHVEVLTASVRSIDHFLESIKLGSDIITAPFKIIKEWADMDMKVPGDDFVYNPEDLKTIEYKELDLNKNWSEFNLHHELTDKGMEKFSADWNALIKQS